MNEYYLYINKLTLMLYRYGNSKERNHVRTYILQMYTHVEKLSQFVQRYLFFVQHIRTHYLPLLGIGESEKFLWYTARKCHVYPQ